MNTKIQIDSATGSIFDTIGALCQKNGIEDASGARRAIASRIESGDFKTAAAWIGCTEQEVRDLKIKFQNQRNT